MSISSEITRLQNLKNELREKLFEMNIVESTAGLFECVNAVKGIIQHGALRKTLDSKTKSYTIPKGYHNGDGIINVVTEEKTALGNGIILPTDGKLLSKVTVNVQSALTLQSKNVTPTKSVQNIVPDEGYDGLSLVKVEAIPASYASVANVSATAGDVLANKIFVDKNGIEKAGTMINNGAVSASIDGIAKMSYTIPAGYHNGSGKVTLTGDIEAALAAI